MGPTLHRRTVLALGSSALALSPALLARTAPTRGAPAAPVPRFVITDRRYPSSVAFSHSLVRAGSVPLDVTAGLTRLWRDQLLPHWQQASAGAVAGLTTREVWRCLAEQARSHSRHGVIVARRAASDNLVSWLID